MEELRPPVVVGVGLRLVVLDEQGAAIGGERAGQRRKLYPSSLGVFDPVPRRARSHAVVHFAPVLRGLMARD